MFFFFFLNLWVFFVLEEETSYECMLYAGIKKSGNMITYFNVGNVIGLRYCSQRQYTFTYIPSALYKVDAGKWPNLSFFANVVASTAYFGHQILFFFLPFFFFRFVLIYVVGFYHYLYVTCDSLPCTVCDQCLLWYDLTHPAFVRWRRFRCDNLSDTETEKKKKNANASTIQLDRLMNDSHPNRKKKQI